LLGVTYLNKYQANLKIWINYYGTEIDDPKIHRLAVVEAARKANFEYALDCYQKMVTTPQTDVIPFFEEVYEIEIVKLKRFLNNFHLIYSEEVQPLPIKTKIIILQIMRRHFNKLKDTKQEEVGKMLSIAEKVNEVIRIASNRMFVQILNG
jgi:hypothetical protein